MLLDLQDPEEHLVLLDLLDHQDPQDQEVPLDPQVSRPSNFLLISCKMSRYIVLVF